MDIELMESYEPWQCESCDSKFKEGIQHVSVNNGEIIICKRCAQKTLNALKEIFE